MIKDKKKLKLMMYRNHKCICAICGKHMEYPDMRLYESPGKVILPIHKKCGGKRFFGLF